MKYRDAFKVAAFKIDKWASDPASSEVISYEDLLSLIRPDVGGARAAAIVGSLIQEKFLAQVQVNPVLFEITRKFFEYCDDEREASAKDSEIKLDTDQAESEIDSWEPLPLERSGELFENAVETTERALEEIRGNNGFAQSEPKNYEKTVWSLSKGLDFLKNGLPDKNQIKSTLIRPLSYLSKKFADTAIGNISRAAVDALMKYLISLN